MDKLKNKRKQSKAQEKSQAQLYNINEKILRDKYLNAYNERSLEDTDFDYQSMFIMQKINEWLSKLNKEKKPEQEKELQLMFKAALSLYNYKNSLNNKMILSLSYNRKISAELNIAKEEINQLKKQLKISNAEIEYYERENNKS